MANQDIVSYLKQQLNKGEQPEAIKAALLGVGWQEKDINEAIEEIIPKIEIKKQEAPIQKTDENKFNINPGTVKIVKQKEFTAPTKPLLLMLFSKKTILVPLIILLFGGVSAFSYFKIYENPNRIIANAWSTLSKIKSGEYAITITAETNREGSLDLPFLNIKDKNSAEIQVDGKFNAENANEPKSFFTANVKTDVFSANSPASYTIDGGFEDGSFYIKSDNAPILPSINLDIFKNKWVRLDWNSKEFLSSASAGILKTKNEVIFDEKLIPETINNEESYHYGIALNKESLKEVLNAFNLSEDIVEVLNTAKSADGEIWIGKKSSLPLKTTINLVLEGKENGVVWNVKLVGLLKNINSSPQIEKPESAKTIEEIAIESIIQKPVEKKN